MRLADFAPRWVMPGNWDFATAPLYIGVSFLCPHCDPALPEHGQSRRQRIVAMFYPPIDPRGLQAKYGPGWWPKRPNDHQRVSGETFDTLTLAPSIGFESIGHWHGTINNGACL